MAEVKQRHKIFQYTNSIQWQEAKKGILSSQDKPDIAIATPLEFLGHAGFWSPEDLFLASVNSCIMTTFLYYAQRKRLQFLSYTSRAEGILEMVRGGFMFSEVKVEPQILVRQDIDIQRAREFMELSEKNCFISSSIKSKVKVIPYIEAQKDRIDQENI